MSVLKKRLLVFLILLCVGTILITNWLGIVLRPIVIKYGDYECENLVVQVTNQIVKQISNNKVTQQAIKYNEEDSSLTFNVDILNSVSATTISKLQYYLRKIEKGDIQELNVNNTNIENNSDFNGLVYSIPFSRAFDNAIISSFGGEISVRYKMIGKVSGEIISEIKEYGINNALVQISLNISCKALMMSPVYSDERDIKVVVPLVMKMIQGKIPDNFYGTQVIGGKN